MFRPVLLAMLFAAASSGANALCSNGQQEMSVEGVQGIFCVDGPKICIAKISDGNCPLPQNGLPNGSYCGVVASGVYGCKTNTTPAPPVTTAPPPTAAPTTAAPVATAPAPVATSAATPGPAPATRCATGYEMSVEGVPGIFCVAQGPICLADRSTGTCPGPQTGLPNGSSCGRVASGVYGCKVNGAGGPAPAPAPGPAASTPASGTPAATATSSPGAVVPAPAPGPAPAAGGRCAAGQYEMSVEGVPGIFCLSQGPICMAERGTGTCPAAQTGLPNGSYCGRVASGVFGCKAGVAPGGNTPTTFAPQDVVDPPKNPAPTPAPVPSSTTPTPVPTDGSQCKKGEYEMSVEGVRGVFCLSQGPICMAERGTGTCPAAQTGLPNGSYCGRVASGVFGCKAGVAPGGNTPTTFAPQDVVDPPKNPAPTPAPVPSSTTPTPVPTDGSQCKKGEYEMSVEGVRGVFCLASGPICIATISNGACPGPQFGLPNGSSCGRVASGVYGCKPNGANGPAPAPASTPATTAPKPAPASTPATTAPKPAPASTPATTAPTPAPVPSTTAPTPAPAPATTAPVTASPSGVCSNGGSPMSIEGVPVIFCVNEPACVQQRSWGNCPGPQPGLPYGSRCDVIASTGVYGCKPKSASLLRA